MNQISTMFLSITLFLLHLFSYHWNFILTKYSLERNSKGRLTVTNILFSMIPWDFLGGIAFFSISHVITIGWNDAGLLKCHIFALCEHRQEPLPNHSLYRKSKPSSTSQGWANGSSRASESIFLHLCMGFHSSIISFTSFPISSYWAVGA